MVKENNVNINITGKTNSFDKAVDKTGKSLDNLKKRSEGLKKLVKASTITSGLNAATDLIGKAVAAVNELTDAFNEQKAAETALEQAAANNPYMNGESVSRLKEFAAQMQQATGVADNELLPMLAQLTAAGRTEAESMAVVRAALDMAASGAMSFDSAARNLAKTYSGLAGELGETLPQVRALTAEQLKSGEAVKIISELYGGMAESVAESAGGQKKLSNAIQSAKEEIGAMFSRGTEGARNFFAGLVQGWADARRAKREYEEAQESEIRETESAYERARAGETNAKLEHVRNTIKNLQEQAEGLKKQREEFAKSMVNLATVNPDEIKGMSMEEAWDAQLKKYISDINFGKEHLEAIAELEKEIAAQKEIAAAYQEQITAEQEKQTQAAEEAARAAAKAEADAKALKAIRHYREKVAAAEEEIRIRRELGEEITRTAELEEMAGVKTQAALEMIREAGGNITTENSFFKAIQEDIAGNAAELAELESAAEAARSLKERIAGFLESIDGASGKTELPEWKQISDGVVSLSEELAALADSLPETDVEEIRGKIAEIRASLLGGDDDEETQPLSAQLLAEAEAIAKEAADLELKAKEAALEGKLDLEREYLATVEELYSLSNQKILEADEEKRNESLSKWQQGLEEAAKVVGQLSEIIDGATAIFQEAAEMRLQKELADLDAAYENGTISEEEYTRKTTEAKKKAAKEEYKIKMWQWTASIAEATANIAAGVIQALASSAPPMSYVYAGLTGAAGAVQIASLIAAKPIPPSFATGGIVGGSSYYGDRVQANLNSREMVLNMGQQKNLFDAINTGNMGGGAVNVVVNNSASNLVTAEPKITRGQIELMIDARVNESMRKGRYSSSMTQAQQAAGGKYFGI